MTTKFSFNEYKKIILNYKDIIKDFKNINRATKSFCLIRHDVEFSVDRALELAKIDYSLGIRSSFFFQVRNSCYNGISNDSIQKIKKIIDFKHFVGLHLYITNIKNNKKLIRKELINQVKTLELAIGKKIDRISIHRPSKWILQQKKDLFQPYINTYSDLYFEFGENPKTIKYYADSNHTWNYGYPINKFDKYKKFQILLHPDEWSKSGADQRKNLKNLIIENKLKFIRDINNEYKTFKLFFKKQWKKI